MKSSIFSPGNHFHLFRHTIEVKHEELPSHIFERLAHVSQATNSTLLTELDSLENGLTHQETEKRLRIYGLNEVIHDSQESWLIRLVRTFNNPLILLLLALAVVGIVTGDTRAAVIISLMILLGVVIHFIQETQAYNAARKLRSLVRTTCTVIREGKQHDIDLAHVVKGDILVLNAGDILPADVRILTSKDLFVNQSLLTGEALPVEKHATHVSNKVSDLFSLTNLCFMGTNVESGTATALVVATGSETYFGSLAKSIAGQRVPTSFDKGVDRFTWLMMSFIAVMVPAVFLINGFARHDWWQAFLFAVSVAVGLTPEMLPALVAVNLSKGTMMMAKKKAIVKRLSSIQNFGAMDVLCTDKTGTLTQNKITLISNLNVKGEDDDKVLDYAYLNSINQTGFTNLLDTAVIKHATKMKRTNIETIFEKIDEIPFDFKRRRLSVIMKNQKGQRVLICKGAVEEIIGLCEKYELHGSHHKITDSVRANINSLDTKYSQDGYRVIALAYKIIDEKKDHFSKHDEDDLLFLGFMTFLDPPKDTAAEAIQQLCAYGITTKVLTGDNELVTKKICSEVGINFDSILLGNQIERMTKSELNQAVERTNVFAKLSPDHKKRVIEALQHNAHVVGFLGDGINDAPGLRTADVGISVDSAVDIAKESADIILLEMSLLVLIDGVKEGRRVFGNIIKYIKMGASSNFGNMFSVLGASILLPFFPMQPIQLLANNLLYDVSQTTIPTDSVDEEYLLKPRKWEIGDIGKFMLFIGPISSIFDYATFAVMWFVFHASNNPSLFQAGWFVESLATQTLIVHVIRSRKIPFLQTHASPALLATTILVIVAGALLTQPPLAQFLQFSPLPALYWVILCIIIFLYMTLTQIVKTIYIKKFGYN